MDVESAPSIDLALITAVVVAGGRGARLGGTELGDKARVLLAGRSLLDVALSAIPDAVGVIVVGPTMPSERSVVWAQERPAGGGPVAAIAAAVDAVETEWVAVLPGDAPRAGLAIRPMADAFGSAADSVGAAVVVESGTGRPNPLLALWRRSALIDSLAYMHRRGGVRDRAAAELFTTVATVDVTDGDHWSDDVDSPDDLARVEARFDRPRSTGVSAPSHPDARLER